MKTNALTTKETSRLAELEKVIHENIMSFYRLGSALKEIHDRKLYRAEFKDFESYCKERWSFGKSQGYRLIESTKIIQNLSPIGDILPINESQIRPLAKLKPEKQKKAWKKAVETAPEGKVTAAHVKKIVLELAPKKRKIHR